MSAYNNDPYSYEFNQETYNQGGQNNYQKRRRIRFFNPFPSNTTGLEKSVIIFGIAALIGFFIWGYTSQSARNRDLQRSIHIQNVIDAIDSFYQNSSTELSQKKYPISTCTASLNAVDYEFTLKQHLTGQIPRLDNHVYVTPEDFPNDPWGRYSSTLEDREIPYPCASLVTTGTADIYNDGTESCNFSSSQDKKFKQCYLYRSSTNGESFSIGYYSEELDQFIVYERFRDGDIQLAQ